MASPHVTKAMAVGKTAMPKIENHAEGAVGKINDLCIMARNGRSSRAHTSMHHATMVIFEPLRMRSLPQ